MSLSTQEVGSTQHDEQPQVYSTQANGALCAEQEAIPTGNWLAQTSGVTSHQRHDADRRKNDGQGGGAVLRAAGQDGRQETTLRHAQQLEAVAAHLRLRAYMHVRLRNIIEHMLYKSHGDCMPGLELHSRGKQVMVTLHSCAVKL